jgi:hypothetical protein
VEEGEGSAGVELNAENALLLAGVDDETVVAWTAEDGGAIGVESGDISWIVYTDRLVMAEIENDAGFTVWEQALMSVAANEALGIPQAAYEVGERGRRLVADVTHGAIVESF